MNRGFGEYEREGSSPPARRLLRRSGGLLMLKTCSGWRVRTRVVMDDGFAWGSSSSGGRIDPERGGRRGTERRAWTQPPRQSFSAPIETSSIRKTRQCGSQARVKMCSDAGAGVVDLSDAVLPIEWSRKSCLASDGGEEARRNFLARLFTRLCWAGAR